MVLRPAARSKLNAGIFVHWCTADLVSTWLHLVILRVSWKRWFHWCLERRKHGSCVAAVGSTAFLMTTYATSVGTCVRRECVFWSNSRLLPWKLSGWPWSSCTAVPSQHFAAVTHLEWLAQMGRHPRTKRGRSWSGQYTTSQLVSPLAT